MPSAANEPAAGPVGPAGVPAVPHGKTARRLEWRFLPPELRALIEDRLGAPVAAAVSKTAGFTPGFASVLSPETGVPTFVKAANRVAQPEVAASYAEEARKVTLLGDRIPAPRLQWTSIDDSWVVLGYEAVAARAPRRPWRLPDLTRALDLAEAVIEATDQIPEGLDLQPLYVDLPPLLTGWQTVPGSWPHRAEAAELAARLPELAAADHFVHADLRDDNILLTTDGRALACDWNWPALGPAWQDTVDLLVSAHGDGIDVQPLIGSRRLTRDADPEEIDTWLAALCGFMLAARRRPAPASSPALRTHTDWYAEAAWSLLARRRNWIR